MRWIVGWVERGETHQNSHETARGGIISVLQSTSLRKAIIGLDRCRASPEEPPPGGGVSKGDCSLRSRSGSGRFLNAIDNSPNPHPEERPPSTGWGRVSKDAQRACSRSFGFRKTP